MDTPDPGFPQQQASREKTTIGTESERRHAASVALEGVEAVAGVRAPQAYCAIATAASQQATTWAEGNGHHSPPMSFDRT